MCDPKDARDGSTMQNNLAGEQHMILSVPDDTAADIDKWLDAAEMNDDEGSVEIEMRKDGGATLWVNGEKYVFSQDVLEAGRKLFQQFKVIQ